ncbi:unnamed protein product [Rotaria sp. Silwood1]|nr:unnamed protein product [Rotaria sp. Silwood1]
MNLDLLPNEILLILFAYFNGIDLLHAFYGLNSRFNLLLYNQFQAYYFCFSSLSKRKFDMICQQHLPFICDRIITLTLTDDEDTPEEIDLFFSYILSFKWFTHLPLLDYAPRLQSLSISRNQSLPLQISLFKYRNVSVRYLNLKNYNYQFNEEECLRLNYSPLGVQCEVLFINVKNRESIMILVKNMINLRTLHIKCEDDKYSKHLSLTENVDESHNANTLNKDDLVQWLKDSLASTCLIVTNPDFANSISIWI